MSQQPGRISSPEATGAGGTFFEQHANATFLALLLRASSAQNQYKGAFSRIEYS
jgi:hypothetical protein